MTRNLATIFPLSTNVVRSEKRALEDQPCDSSQEKSPSEAPKESWPSTKENDGNNGSTSGSVEAKQVVSTREVDDGSYLTGWRLNTLLVG
jgi:hypothetical protein